jgi:hypothetical protein
MPERHLLLDYIIILIHNLRTKKIPERVFYHIELLGNSVYFQKKRLLFVLNLLQLLQKKLIYNNIYNIIID